MSTMPEGPEVRTLVGELNDALHNTKIIGVKVADDNTTVFSNLDAKAFAKKVVGKKILKVNRIGKYIDFVLDDSYHIVTHLLITGRFSLLSKTDKLPKYFRAALVLENEKILCLGDRRHWSKLTYMHPDDVGLLAKRIGIDVFSPDFTKAILSKLIKMNKPIHPILLDQSKVSGVGNIYANEVLFITKIHPQTKGKDIPEEKVQDLHRTLIEILELAFQEKGTTVLSFLERDSSGVGWHTLDGKPGGFWKHVKIFDKAGSPCPNCHTPITKIQISGRNAFFCPLCQK